MDKREILNMIFILIFLFISICIELFILGIIYSKIIVNIENLEVNSINKQVNIDTIVISLEIKLYKIFKILKIKFYKDYFKILGIKVNYKKALKYETKNELTEKVYKFINKNKIQIKNLKPNLEYFKFELNFGTEDVIITSILTAMFSGAIVLLLKKFVRKINKEDYSFKITPNYFNVNNFNVKFKSKINFNLNSVF